MDNMTDLTEGAIRGVNHPEIFELNWDNEVLLSAEREAITKIAPTLRASKLLVSNAETADVIANLTGKCQPAQLTNLEELFYFTYTEKEGLMATFGRDLISAVNSTKLRNADFSFSSISYFEDQYALEPLAVLSLTQVMFDRNRLQTVPQGLFDPLVKLNRTIRIILRSNLWHCDGNLRYLQDTMRDKSHKLEFESDDVWCSTPTELQNTHVIDADLSGNFEPLPPAPRLNITCV